MKVLVTGASGFIGMRIVEAVENKGWTAVGTSRTGSDGLIRLDVTAVASFGNVRQFSPFDVVVHCAGIAHRFAAAGREYESVNVSGTRNVAEFAAGSGAKHLVHLSSVLVYGRHGSRIAESDGCRSKDAYAASKLRSEDAAVEVAKQKGMPLTILRPAPVIGENCKGNFARLVRAIDRGRFAMVGGGANRKSLVYVGDVADACLRAIETEASDTPGIFNVAAESVSTREIVDSIYRSLGSKQPSFWIPAAPLSLGARAASTLLPFSRVRSATRSLETWVAEDVYSTDAIRDRLGFEAKVPIDEAIRRTVKAYRDSLGD